MKGTFFITGIDTNIGKSYATGWLAREWNSKGIKTITQKMIQTGECRPLRRHRPTSGNHGNTVHPGG